MLLLRLVG